MRPIHICPAAIAPEKIAQTVPGRNGQITLTKKCGPIINEIAG
jgi:hypothetical protein